MQHYTLNTGHNAEIDLRVAAPTEVRQLLLPIVRRGGGNLPPPWSAYSVAISLAAGCGVFTFSRGREILSTTGFAFSAEAAGEVWTLLETLYLRATDNMPYAGEAPMRPDTHPWIATIVWPPFAKLARSDAVALAGAEQCIAATAGQLLDD